MNLYIVRHGETDWNKNKKIQGLTDIELNEKGIYQANKMKEKLLNVNFDICICSPLKRAVKTAQIIVDQKCDIIVNEALLERCFGNYEGQNSKEANIDIFKIWNLKENCKDNGIESLRDLLERSDLFLKKFKEEYVMVFGNDKDYLFMKVEDMVYRVNLIINSIIIDLYGITDKNTIKNAIVSLLDNHETYLFDGISYDSSDYEVIHDYNQDIMEYLIHKW